MTDLRGTRKDRWKGSDTMQEYMVAAEDEGKRLREILRGRMRISYSAMKSAKWNGEIRLNGEKRTVDVRVQRGDRIEIVMPEREPVFS